MKGKEKVINCADLVAGCMAVIRSDDEKDIVHKVADHLKREHNIEFTADMRSATESLIRKQERAA